MLTHTLAGLTSLGGLPEHASREGNAVWWEGKGFVTRVEVETLPDPERKRRAEVRIVSRLTEGTLPALDAWDISRVNGYAGLGALRRAADGALEMAGALVLDQTHAQDATAWLMHAARAARLMGEGGLGLIYCSLVDRTMYEAWRTRLGLPHAWQERPRVEELGAAAVELAGRGLEAHVDEETVMLDFTVPMAASLPAQGSGGEWRPESLVHVGLGIGHVHPLYGPGYRAHSFTTLPGEWTVEDTLAFAEGLNVSEQARRRWWVPRLGAWRCKGAGMIEYESHVGTEVPWPGLVEQLTMGMLERVGWVEEEVRRRGWR